MSEHESNKGCHEALIQDIAYAFTAEMKCNPKCLCENSSCSRHGICKACMAFHRATKHPPTCRYLWKWPEE